MRPVCRRSPSRVWAKSLSSPATFGWQAPDAFTILSARKQLAPATRRRSGYFARHTQDAGDIFILSNDPSTPEAVAPMGKPSAAAVRPSGSTSATRRWATPSLAPSTSSMPAAMCSTSHWWRYWRRLHRGSVPAPRCHRHPHRGLLHASLESNYAGIEIWADSNTPAGSTKADILPLHRKARGHLQRHPEGPYALYDTVTFIGTALRPKWRRNRGLGVGAHLQARGLVGGHAQRHGPDQQNSSVCGLVAGWSTNDSGGSDPLPGRPYRRDLYGRDVLGCAAGRHGPSLGGPGLSALGR